MPRPLIRQGEGPTAAYARDYELRVQQARALARILLEVGEAAPVRVTSSAAGGDTQRLRGLPAIGHGVSGAVPGSNPLKALLAKEKRSGRRRP